MLWHGMRHAPGISVEENQRSLQMATAVSSGSRWAVNHNDRAVHASLVSGIFAHSSASKAPTQGMKYDAISGFTLKPASSRETMIARPAASDGRHGKISRPSGPSPPTPHSRAPTPPPLP